MVAAHQFAMRQDAMRRRADEEILDAAAVDLPVPHRPGVDMDEMRVRIPADAAALHRQRRFLGLGDLAAKGDVERLAEKMLALFGDAEILLAQLAVGFWR